MKREGAERGETIKRLEEKVGRIEKNGGGGGGNGGGVRGERMGNPRFIDLGEDEID